MEFFCWIERRREDKTSDIGDTCGTPDVDADADYIK
jgi:hypothetical protein